VGLLQREHPTIARNMGSFWDKGDKEDKGTRGQREGGRKKELTEIPFISGRVEENCYQSSPPIRNRTCDFHRIRLLKVC